MVLSEEEIILKVQKDYNTIYNHFSKTRTHPWPEFSIILELISPKSRILDLGAGNCRLGKFLKEKGKEIEYYAVDISEKMLQECHRTMPEAKTYLTKSSSLPFPADFFDMVVSVALFHHLPPQELQNTIKEIKRVLKKGGIVFCCWWNMWQKRFWKEHLKSAVGALLRKNRWGELFVSFTDPEKKIEVKRYVRALSLRKLKKLFEKEGFIIEKAFPGWRKNNLCLIAKKT